MYMVFKTYCTVFTEPWPKLSLIQQYVPKLTFRNSFKCLQISQTFEVLDIWSVQVFMAIIFSVTCSAVVKLAHSFGLRFVRLMKPLSFFNLTRLAWIC